MAKTQAENEITLREDIKDGKRFSLDVKKKGKKLPERAKRMRRRALEYAIQAGVVDAEKELTGFESEKKTAELLVAKTMGGELPISLDTLTDDDVAFINQLPDDGTRDIVIRQLFGNRALSSIKKLEEKGVQVQPKKTRRMEVFIKEYKRNYDNMLAGKHGESLQAIKNKAGYTESVPVSVVMKAPWVAKQLDEYHKAVEFINEYHYTQIDDREQRLKARVLDLKERIVKEHLDDPTKLSKTGVRDQAAFLKAINEITQEKSSDRKSPMVAIQFNAASANVAMQQDQEKKAHFESSFN